MLHPLLGIDASSRYNELNLQRSNVIANEFYKGIIILLLNCRKKKKGKKRRSSK